MARSKKIISFRWLIWVIVLVILGALVGGRFYFINKQVHMSERPDKSNSGLKTYSSTTYHYTFNYASNLDLSSANSNELGDYLTQVNGDNGLLFNVVIVSKSPQAGYHDGKAYDPFTYDLNKILTAQVGENGKTTNGSQYRRLSDEKVGNQPAKVFDWIGAKRFVIDTPHYYYVLLVANDNVAAEQILSTFTLKN